MQNKEYRIGCILMAAGNAERFHSNKLNAMLNGKTLFSRALDVIPTQELYQVVVVTQYEELARQARERGFLAQLNEHPEAGLSHTIALGIGALHDAQALMFLVADQPLLRKQSVENAIMLHRANPEYIVSLAFGERTGNPCIFPREFFPALFALQGDLGGKAVIDANRNRLMLSYAQDGRELTDVDTVEALHSLLR